MTRVPIHSPQADRRLHQIDAAVSMLVRLLARQVARQVAGEACPDSNIKEAKNESPE
jgi:hypothetical protein